MIIYSKEIKTTRRGVEDTIKENSEECMLMGGDFNGKVAETGSRTWKEKRGDGKRKSKDNVENAEGKMLMEWIELHGWEVLNGNKQENEEAWDKVGEFRIGEKVESDHLPLEISIEETNNEEKGRGREKKEQKKVIIKIWDEQGVEQY
jgi:hypothetical protein